MSLTLQELIEEAGLTSKEKGFYDQPLNVGEQLMLIVSEAAEAMEDYRNHEKPDGPGSQGYALTSFMYDMGDSGIGVMFGDMFVEGKVYKPIGFASELADIVIRVATLSHRMNIDLERAIVEKMRFNRTRPFQHGGKKV